MMSETNFDATAEIRQPRGLFLGILISTAIWWVLIDSAARLFT
jgi:hypothetical protein